MQPVASDCESITKGVCFMNLRVFYQWFSTKEVGELVPPEDNWQGLETVLI